MMKDMREMKIELTTLAPVIVTAAHDAQVMTRAQRLVPGSVLRGVLATRFIERKHLGEAAHRDEAFRALFFQRLRFLPGYPVQGKGRAFPLPLSLMKSKPQGEEAPVIKDRFLHKGAEETQGLKSFRGMAVRNGDSIATVSVRTSISLHMTRTTEGSRLLGRSTEGGIFNYEAIAPGQSFAASILGTEEDLRSLLGTLELDEGEGFDCRIGRSHYTEYGRTRLTVRAIGDPPAITAEDVEGDRVILRLDSPFLPGAASLEGASLPSARELLSQALEKALGDTVELQEVYAGAEEIDAFRGVWHLPAPRVAGLAAGTVFSLLRKGGWTETELASLSALCLQGIGSQRAEGCGQLRAWRLGELTLGGMEEAEEAQPAPPIPASVQERVKTILLRRIQESLRVAAYEDVAHLNIKRGQAHFFSELSDMFQYAYRLENMQEGIAAILEGRETHGDGVERAKQWKSDTPFQTTLGKLRLYGKPLKRYLTQKNPPYLREGDQSLEVAVGLSTEEFDRFLDRVSLTREDFAFETGACCFEYWRWFCRYGRKKAYAVGRDA